MVNPEDLSSMGDYQRLQTDAETEILPPIEPKVPSPCYHRTCFIFSLTFTFAVVFFFLWGLPCDLDSCNVKHLVSWDKTFYGLELKGHMHLVGGHIVCMVRAALWGKVSTGFTPHTGGIVAISALTGELVYYIRLVNPPLRLDCSLLGNRRCLVLGDKGILFALDYLSGMVSWHMKSQNTSVWPQPVEIDFPLATPARGELITLSRFEPGQHRLLFISMETGLIISEPHVNKDCFHVHNLTYSAEGDLHYTCVNKEEDSWIMSYKLSDAKGKGVIVTEPVDYTKRMPNEEGGAGEHKVAWTNSGLCPSNCLVSVAVTDSSNRTVWSYASERTHVMTPLPLRFRPHITGFLIRLWQWQEHSMSSSNGLKVELIKERIVLITFNKSGSMHVVNASQTDITQLCNVNNDECQPQLSFQTQSALLVDANADGSQDLISYFVTYHSPSENNHSPDKVKDWELQSKVRVVRLEAELPKLYDAVSKH